MPTFCIFRSISNRSVIISILACGVVFVIAVVDLTASLSKALSFFHLLDCVNGIPPWHAGI